MSEVYVRFPIFFRGTYIRICEKNLLDHSSILTVTTILMEYLDEQRLQLDDPPHGLTEGDRLVVAVVEVQLMTKQKKVHCMIVI